MRDAASKNGQRPIARDFARILYPKGDDGREAAGYTTTPGCMPIQLRDRVANRPPMVTDDRQVGRAGVRVLGSGVARSRVPDNARWRLGGRFVSERGGMPGAYQGVRPADRIMSRIL